MAWVRVVKHSVLGMVKDCDPGCILKVELGGFVMWKDEEKEMDERVPQVLVLSRWKDEHAIN